jgi:hypothetical protein
VSGARHIFGHTILNEWPGEIKQRLAMFLRDELRPELSQERRW